MNRVLLLCGVTLLCGCPAQLRYYTAQATRCLAEVVEVSDAQYELAGTSWSATCGDEAYLCRMTTRGGSSSSVNVFCSQSEREASPGPSPQTLPGRLEQRRMQLRQLLQAEPRPPVAPVAAPALQGGQN